VEFPNKQLEATRGNVRAQEARVARQREMIAAAEAARHPLDDLRARLLIMEQSLLVMKRFLKILERELEASLGPRRSRRSKLSRSKKQEAEPSSRARTDRHEP
jgi:hypothetical protein